MSPFGSIYIIKKHVSSLIFQDKINGSNFRTPEEEHLGPGGQDHQGQGDAHHVAGGVVLRRKYISMGDF